MRDGVRKETEKAGSNSYRRREQSRRGRLTAILRDQRGPGVTAGKGTSRRISCLLVYTRALPGGGPKKGEDQNVTGKDRRFLNDPERRGGTLREAVAESWAKSRRDTCAHKTPQVFEPSREGTGKTCRWGKKNAAAWQKLERKNMRYGGNCLEARRSTKSPSRLFAPSGEKRGAYGLGIWFKAVHEEIPQKSKEDQTVCRRARER